MVEGRPVGGSAGLPKVHRKWRCRCPELPRDGGRPVDMRGVVHIPISPGTLSFPGTTAQRVGERESHRLQRRRFAMVGDGIAEPALEAIALTKHYRRGAWRCRTCRCGSRVGRPPHSWDPTRPGSRRSSRPGSASSAPLPAASACAASTRGSDRVGALRHLAYVPQQSFLYRELTRCGPSAPGVRGLAATSTSPWRPRTSTRWASPGQHGRALCRVASRRR